MSFGFSVGDFITLIQLAKSTYKDCVAAGAEYIEIARVIKSLHGVLKALRDETQKVDSPLFSRDQDSAKKLLTAINDCNHILEDLQTLLAKYEGLSTNGEAVSATRKLWHRLRFSTKIDQLEVVRSKLITYMSIISTMLDCAQLRATGRIEERIDNISSQMMGGFEDLRKAICGMAVKARAEQRNGSAMSLLSLSTHAEDNKEVWCEFRRGLIAKGFRSKDLDRHKDSLQAYMLKLDQSGVLDEVQDAPGQNITPPWWKKHAFAETVNSIPDLQPVNEEYVTASLSQRDASDSLQSLQPSHTVDDADRGSVPASEPPLQFQREVKEDRYAIRDTRIGLHEWKALSELKDKDVVASPDDALTYSLVLTDSEETEAATVDLKQSWGSDETLVDPKLTVIYDYAQPRSGSATPYGGTSTPSSTRGNHLSSAGSQRTPPLGPPTSQTFERLEHPQTSASAVRYSNFATLDGTSLKGNLDAETQRKNYLAWKSMRPNVRVYQPPKPPLKEFTPQSTTGESGGCDHRRPTTKFSESSNEEFSKGFTTGNVAYGKNSRKYLPESNSRANEHRFSDDSAISGILSVQKTDLPPQLTLISKEEVQNCLSTNDDFLFRRQQSRMDFQEQLRAEKFQVETFLGIHRLGEGSIVMGHNRIVPEMQIAGSPNPPPGASGVQVIHDVSTEENNKGQTKYATSGKRPLCAYVESASESDSESPSIEMDTPPKQYGSAKSNPNPGLELPRGEYLFPNLAPTPEHKVSFERKREPSSMQLKPPSPEYWGRRNTPEFEERRPSPVIVSPPQEVEKPGERKLRGILRPPREKFPEDPNPIREGVAPLKKGKMAGIPVDARWTKISRHLVNCEALEAGKERYEAREHFIIVLRVLTKEEIEGYAIATRKIRDARLQLEEMEEREERRHQRRELYEDTP